MLPDLPTVADTVPGYEATIWLGIMAPKATPAEVVGRLNKAVSDIVGSPEVKAAWGKDGAVPMVMQPTVFHAFMDEDIVKWAKVVKLSGAKAGE